MVSFLGLAAKRQTRVAALATRGWIEPHSATSISELIRAIDHNTGNLVFQHAVTKLLDCDWRHVSDYTDPRACSGVSHIILPAANQLRPGLDLSSLAAFLRRWPLPTVVLGLGAQADATDPTEEDVKAIANDPSVRDLAGALNGSAVFISVRGNFSERVSVALGLKNVETWGCPSLLIHSSPRLGASIALGLAEAREKAKSYSLRLAISAGAPFEIYEHGAAKLAAERRFISWARTYDSLYVQQSGGADVLEMARGNIANVDPSALRSMREVLAPEMTEGEFIGFSLAHQRLYTDARKWAEVVGRYDLMIGTRMHGNMLALGAGIPAIHVIHDSRTAELVETMKTPFVRLSDVIECERIEDLIERVNFDPECFDANRIRIARRFLEMAEGQRIKPSATLRDLARG